MQFYFNSAKIINISMQGMFVQLQDTESSMMLLLLHCCFMSTVNI